MYVCICICVCVYIHVRPKKSSPQWCPCGHVCMSGWMYVRMSVHVCACACVYPPHMLYAHHRYSMNVCCVAWSRASFGRSTVAAVSRRASRLNSTGHGDPLPGPTGSCSDEQAGRSPLHALRMHTHTPARASHLRVSHSAHSGLTPSSLEV